MPITLESYDKICKHSNSFADMFEEHLRKLNLLQLNNIKKSLKAYYTFCDQHGFKRTLDKTYMEFAKEARYVSVVKADKSLKKGKFRDRSIKKFLQYLLELSTKERKDIAEIKGQPVIEAISNNCKPMFDEDQKKFINLLIHIEKVAKKLLTVTDYIVPVATLVYFNHHWVRDYSEWNPNSYNSHRQFSDLLNFLLCKYPIPKFLESAWLKNDNDRYITFENVVNSSKYQEIELFLHLAKGSSIRKYPKLKYVISKKTAHHFMMAPNDYSVEEAFRWGYIHSLGGDKRTVNGLRDTWLFRQKPQPEPFRESVIKFFISHPFLDTAHYNPIADYIWHMKFEPREEYNEATEEYDRTPTQPNFSMSGRTVDSLLAQVERWHRQLGKEKKKSRANEWKHQRDINDYILKYGTPEKGNVRIISIRELTTRTELSKEGRAMKNCVASYANSCATGRCSIWSLRREYQFGIKHLATIEVSNRTIIQAKSMGNKKVESKNMEYIKRWTNKEGIRIQNYL